MIIWAGGKIILGGGKIFLAGLVTTHPVRAREALGFLNNDDDDDGDDADDDDDDDNDDVQRVAGVWEKPGRGYRSRSFGSGMIFIVNLIIFFVIIFVIVIISNEPSNSS